jgi:NADH-quinone oxidoreductase subunit H
MELSLVIEKFILVAIIFGISLVTAMYSTYAERKVAAFLQDRVGPNRAGPFGIFQPMADGAKMFMKEEIIPTQSSGLLFIIGPSLAILTACIGSAVIPWGQTLTIGSRVIDLQVTDINVGILYIFGVVSLGVYGIVRSNSCSITKHQLRNCNGFIHYCFADVNRNVKPERNSTTTTWLLDERLVYLELLPSATWIFNIYGLCFCRNQS